MPPGKPRVEKAYYYLERKTAVENKIGNDVKEMEWGWGWSLVLEIEGGIKFNLVSIYLIPLLFQALC